MKVSWKQLLTVHSKNTTPANVIDVLKIEILVSLPSFQLYTRTKKKDSYGPCACSSIGYSAGDFADVGSRFCEIDISIRKVHDDSYAELPMQLILIILRTGIDLISNG
jgi:hypothetical protein